MNLSRGTRVCVRIFQVVALAGVAAYAAQAQWAVCGSAADDFFETAVYPALIGAGAVLCLGRGALVRAERAAWLVMGTGLAFWAGGDVYYTLFLDTPAPPPLPSVSDALWLGFYPACYAAIVLLTSARVRGFRASLWLDGVIGALAVAALGAALVVGPISSGADERQVAVDLTYIGGDLLLLGFVVAGFALTGWRPGSGFVVIGAALAASAIADGYFLHALATGAVVDSTLMASLWPASTVLLGIAAWQRPARRTVRLEGRRILTMPLLFGLLALGLLGYHAVEPLNVVSLVLALAALVAMLARMAATYRENLRLLEGTRHEALTDALTGLGNRRRLIDDLAEAVAQATTERPSALVMFDLDGFKHYNDRFGHPVGDALLARLGGALIDTVAGDARAYRLGGDEFCVVASGAPDELRRIALRAQAALSDRGRGFEIGCSYGMVLIPAEATDVPGALHLADDRLYEHKGQTKRAVATRQTSDALLQVLREVQPDLNGHLDEVALLAQQVGRRLRLRPAEIDELIRAAQLHDIGKVAVPADILCKEGPLNEGEWRFMRQHTLVGDRILSAAPSLGPVARLVRASHERYDGAGYPDGLAGDEIPFAARIVAVCDAYHAMTSDRPYRGAVEPAEAVDELRRCAGAQFDPIVVEAFAELIAPALADAGRALSAEAS